MLEMNHLRKIDLTNIYRTLHGTAAEYTVFSSAHRTFSRTDHMTGQKPYLYKHKKTAITPVIFAGHNGMKIEIDKKRKVRGSTNMWKLNNILLTNQRVKEEIKRKKKISKLMKLETWHYQISGMQQNSSERKVYCKKECIY